MQIKTAAMGAALAAALIAPVHAQTEIQWWHSMSGPLGEWVNDLAKQFNASQKDYKVVPTYKGQYDESMTAAIAAFRAGNAPDILQVFEVGTATMMASKGAIKPVGEVMNSGGAKFDPSVYVPAVAGYYTAPNGQMLSFPFNSSTTIFYYNKDDPRDPARIEDQHERAHAHRRQLVHRGADHEAGDHEEHIDAGEAAGQPSGIQVVGHDAQDRDGPKAVDVGGVVAVLLLAHPCLFCCHGGVALRPSRRSAGD